MLFSTDDTGHHRAEHAASELGAPGDRTRNGGPRAVFGIGSGPLERSRLPPSTAGTFRSRSFGTAGGWSLWTRDLDVAESATAVVVCHGRVRAADGEPLAAASLLRRKLISPSGVDAVALRGSAWLASFSKTEPELCVYQTLMALPQLYFAPLPGPRPGLLAASELGPLLELLGRREIDEDMLPSHFLFRLVPGGRTLFRGVSRLYPGQALYWRRDRLSRRTVRDFRDRPELPAGRWRSAGRRAVTWLDERLGQTMGELQRGWREAGKSACNLLSGGEDSSLVQLWLDRHRPQPAPSCSFAIEAPSFRFEVDYALDASRRLGTEHQIFTVAQHEYPALLERSIDVLEQPALYNEGVPGFLALAEALRQRGGEGQVYLAGQAADALHGAFDLPPIDDYRRWRRLPGGGRMLRLRARWLERRGRSARATEILETVAMLEGRSIAGILQTPSRHIALAGEIDWAVRCFGETAVRRAFERRCDLERRSLGAEGLLDRVQGIDLLTAGYDPGAAAGRLFSSQGLELVQFYLDETVIRNVMMFASGCRYRTGLLRPRLKPLQKKMLQQHGQGALAKKHKGGTNFSVDLRAWMRHGVLRSRVEAIAQHGFLPRGWLSELERDPGDSLWNLLIYDLFTKRLVHR